MKHIPNALFLCLFLEIGGLSQSIDNSKKSDLPDSKPRHPPSELRTTWRDYPRTSSEPLQLLVDFVEFTDESVWGLDTCQSADTLAGTRSGARIAVERLQKIFAEGGPRSVVRALDTIIAEIEIPLDKSPVWQQGFLAGRQHMRDRVRQFIGANGVIEVEAVLKQSYDASGYKIDVVLPEPENQGDK